MKPIAKMDVMSWELDYDNVILDNDNKVLNVSEFALQYSADSIIRRCPRFYMHNGNLYLAPEASHCEPLPHTHLP